MSKFRKSLQKPQPRTPERKPVPESKVILFDKRAEDESEAQSPQEGDKKDVKAPALRMFGRDLTELAKKGEVDTLECPRVQGD